MGGDLVDGWFTKSGAPRNLVGLNNLGNTCFMNSILQCLNNTVPLAQYFLSGQASHHIDTSTRTRGRLAVEFGNLVKEMWGAMNNTAVNAAGLKSQISKFAHQFSGYNQHDSQELLRYLLDGLHEELTLTRLDPPYSYDDPKEDERTDNENGLRMHANYLARNCSAIAQLFGGQFKSCVQCATCNRRSCTFDPFMDLSVPIASKSRGGDCDLSDCLSLFFEDETLEKKDQYYCSRCKAHRNARKSLCLFRVPPVLVVHLKRFSKGTWSGHKLNTLVNFPITQLDLSKYYDGPGIEGKPIYELYAISNHMGGLDGGHYVAHCQGPDRRWYSFNDSRVTAANSGRLVDASAYVLFFRQVPTRSLTDVLGRRENIQGKL